MEFSKKKLSYHFIFLYKKYHLGPHNPSTVKNKIRQKRKKKNEEFVIKRGMLPAKRKN